MLVLSLVAAFLTTVSFLPQTIKAIRHSTKSISLFMYSIFVGGVVLWLIYALSTKNLALSLANIFGLLFSSSILIKKIIDVRKEKP